MNRKKSIQTTLDNFITQRTLRKYEEGIIEEITLINQKKKKLEIDREERNEFLQYLKKKIEKYEQLNNNKINKWDEELKVLEETLKQNDK